MILQQSAVSLEVHSFPTRRSSDLSAARRAGRTVSEPSTATATTIIVATPKPMNVLSPVKSIPAIAIMTVRPERSEEHTSELQSLAYLVCRLLLEKKQESM